MTVYLAHDGTIQGDWVAHYAIHLAQNDPAAKLCFVHVEQGRNLTERIGARVDDLAQRCQRVNVAFETMIRPQHGTVVETLCELVPAEEDIYVVCGMRILAEQRGILRGTVAEQLLKRLACHVLALHIVQPGVLGLPRRVLIPVSGHPRGLLGGAPLLRLFLPDVIRIDLLFVQPVSHLRFRRLSFSEVRRLRLSGELYCERVESELRHVLAGGDTELDAHIVVSDDVPNEIVVGANRAKSRLIFMGASERSLSQRLFGASPIERVLSNASCDVGIYRGFDPERSKVKR